MKKMVTMLAAAIFMLSSVSVFSQMTTAEKDECLLAAKNCTSEVDDIQNRIHKIQKEIKKGTRVYTPEELNKLRAKLHEANQMLKEMMKGP